MGVALISAALWIFVLAPIATWVLGFVFSADAAAESVNRSLSPFPKPPNTVGGPELNANMIGIGIVLIACALDLVGRQKCVRFVASQSGAFHLRLSMAATVLTVVGALVMLYRFWSATRAAAPHELPPRLNFGLVLLVEFVASWLFLKVLKSVGEQIYDDSLSERARAMGFQVAIVVLCFLVLIIGFMVAFRFGNRQEMAVVGMVMALSGLPQLVAIFIGIILVVRYGKLLRDFRHTMFACARQPHYDGLAGRPE